MNKYHVNPVQWNEAQGLAHNYCQSFVRRGAEPVDAIVAYGVPVNISKTSDWDKAAQLIALAMCSPAHKRPC